MIGILWHLWGCVPYCLWHKLHASWLLNKRFAICMYLDILENQCKRKLQGRQKLSESRCGSFPCLDTPIISIFLIDSVQSLTYSFNFFSISISIFSLKFCSIVPYKDLYSAYNSCLNAQVTRFTFSAAISKSLELKRSSIAL